MHPALNPQPPSDAVRKQKNFGLEDFFSSVLSQFKKYHPSGSLKFYDLGIFQILKLHILMRKILPISLELKFTPNSLGGYPLNTYFIHISQGKHQRHGPKLHKEYSRDLKFSKFRIQR